MTMKDSESPAGTQKDQDNAGYTNYPGKGTHPGTTEFILTWLFKFSLNYEDKVERKYVAI